MVEQRGGLVLHPRIEELLEHLDETRAAFLTTVESVPPAQRSARPRPGRWSLGELVDHVHKVEAGTLRLLTKRIEQLRARGSESETETSSIFATMDASMVLDRTRPIEAPPTVVPAEGASVEAALSALAESRAALRATLIGASGLPLGAMTHPHPFFGPLDMYQWGLMLGWHDLRHADQVREMRDAASAG
jgi:hypothetical protein